MLLLQRILSPADLISGFAEPVGALNARRTG